MLQKPSGENSPERELNLPNVWIHNHAWVAGVAKSSKHYIFKRHLISNILVFFLNFTSYKKNYFEKGKQRTSRCAYTCTLLYKDIILIHIYMNKHQRNPHSKITSLRITGINIASWTLLALSCWYSKYSFIQT